MKFSILVPAYKRQYLKECIDSILAQTYRDFELIIVNDASPQDIDSIVSQYDDTRLRYYKNEKNIGAKDVVKNWNKCLSYANGDYVLCMGDDDCLYPNCLLEYNNCMEENSKVDVYHIGTAIIDSKGDIIDLQEGRPNYESVYSLLWHRITHRRIQFIGDFLFDRKILISKGGFYELPFASHSDDISVYIASAEKGIININSLGFQYRNNAQTITNTQNLRDTALSVKMATDWIREFLQEEPLNEMDAEHRRQTLFQIDKYKQGLIKHCIKTDLSAQMIDGFRYWKDHYANYDISRRTFWGIAKTVLNAKLRR